MNRKKMFVELNIADFIAKNKPEANAQSDVIITLSQYNEVYVLLFITNSGNSVCFLSLRDFTWVFMKTFHAFSSSSEPFS